MVLVPLAPELFSQEDLGINFGSFSMFRFLDSEELASALDDSLEEKRKGLIKCPRNLPKSYSLFLIIFIHIDGLLLD